MPLQWSRVLNDRVFGIMPVRYGSKGSLARANDEYSPLFPRPKRPRVQLPKEE